MRQLTIRLVAVDDGPHDVVLAGGRRAFVACAASVVGIDLAHGSVTARFPAAPGKKRLALLSDRYLVEACESLGSIRILDLLDAAQTTAALQMPIAGLVATNTGIWFGSEDCLRELDFSGSLGRQIPMPGVMEPMTSDALAAADDLPPYGLGPLATDGESLAYCATRVAGADVLHVVNLHDDTVLGTGWDPQADGEGSTDIVSFPPQPSAERRITDVVLDPTRTNAYVSCTGWFGGTLTQLTAATGDLVRVYNSGFPGRLAHRPTQDVLAIGDADGSDDLEIFSTATGEAYSLDIGQAPDALAFTPDGSLVVCLFDDDTVAILSDVPEPSST